MRITQLNSFNRLKNYLDQNRAELAKYQQQIASHKRVTKASDDSSAFTISRYLQNAVRKNEQYQSNISSGLAKAHASESALQSMLDVLSKFKTVAVSGATDTKDADDRKLLADQVKSLKKKMVDLANTKFNGVYLFAGTDTNTTSATFFKDSNAPGGIKDISNGKSLKVQVSDISSVAVSVNGNDLRNAGGEDLFGIMKTIGEALRNNDPSTVRDNLDSVDKAYNHVVGLTSKLGSHINRMKFLNKQIEGQKIDQKSRVSQLVDTDYAQAILNIQKYEKIYQAALVVHSQIIQTSLVNYL